MKSYSVFHIEQKMEFEKFLVAFLFFEIQFWDNKLFGPWLKDSIHQT